MMRLDSVLITITLWVVLSVLLARVLQGGEANATRSSARSAHHIATNASLTVSKWWRGKDPGDPRAGGCRGRPWMCNRGERPPFRMRCCQNRCVDITSDVNHCGLCSIRCPFTWQCCFGRCKNINKNRKHCGKCFHRCPFGVRCFHGMCGYAERPPKCQPVPCPPAEPAKPPPPCPPEAAEPPPPPPCPPQKPTPQELHKGNLQPTLLPNHPRSSPLPG